jgi:HEAT repeat protein
VSALADRIRALIEQPEESLAELLVALQSSHERPRPRPWSKLCLRAEHEAEAAAMFPQVSRILAPLVAAENSDRRHGALQVLGLVPCPEARAALILGLADPLSICRVAALDGLAACPATGDVVDRIIILLDDPKQPVRLHAASALGLLGDPRAIGPLQRLLVESQDATASVRQWAAFSLSELGYDVGEDLPESSSPAPEAGTDQTEPGEGGGEEDEEAIQREAAQRVVEGFTALIGKLKQKDSVTMGDFVSGLEAMERQFGEDEGETGELG